MAGYKLCLFDYVYIVNIVSMQSLVVKYLKAYYIIY